MVFERTSLLVDQKIFNLGLRLPYRLWRTDCAESFVNEHKRLVVINPEDRKSRILAKQSMQHLLLHELGHIFVHRFINRQIKKDVEFIALFGNLSKHYRRKLSRLKTHQDFISNYAQVHPEDNFCEVFAVYCADEGKIRKVYKHLSKLKKSDKVRAQMLWLHRFVKELKFSRD